MGMLVSAGALLTRYVGLELLSLASYVLAAFQRKDTRSAEAGLKYFVLGALASGILLYGISLLYGFTGSTLFHEVSLAVGRDGLPIGRSEKHTSELQSLMRISYAVFCLKKKTKQTNNDNKLRRH